MGFLLVFVAVFTALVRMVSGVPADNPQTFDAVTTEASGGVYTEAATEPTDTEDVSDENNGAVYNTDASDNAEDSGTVSNDSEDVDSGAVYDDNSGSGFDPSDQEWIDEQSDVIAQCKLDHPNDPTYCVP